MRYKLCIDRRILMIIYTWVNVTGQHYTTHTYRHMIMYTHSHINHVYYVTGPLQYYSRRFFDHEVCRKLLLSLYVVSDYQLVHTSRLSSSKAFSTISTYFAFSVAHQRSVRPVRPSNMKRSAVRPRFKRI